MAEFSQEIDAGAIEIIVQPVKSDVMQSALGSAGTINGGVAVSDAIDHTALLSLPALGTLANHFLVMRPAKAALVTFVVTPELLIRCVELALIDAATAVFGNAPATVQHIAWLALAGLHAGQVALLWSIKGVAGGRTGWATSHILAILRARQSCKTEGMEWTSVIPRLIQGFIFAVYQ